MLTDELKKTIQSNYSQLLDNKKLHARYGQKLMIADITKTLTAVETDAEGLRTSAEPPVCVIEAGTGTGKTIAYMVSALPVAQALGKHLVIATATVALQEQVVFKDLPDLLRHSDMKFNIALAKGRGRYLCLSKLDNVLKENSSQDAMMDLYGLDLDDPSQADMGLYQNMLNALGDQSWKGDRDDWPDNLENHQWQAVSVENGQCSGNRCSNFSNCCFFRSRADVEKADCIVANHDLVLADLSLGGGVILPAPEDTIYIFDEGHHLPNKGTNHFSHYLRLRSTGKWLEQLQVIFTRIEADVGTDTTLAILLNKARDAATETRGQLNQDYFLFEQFSEAAESANARGDILQHTFDKGKVDLEIREVAQHLYVLFSEVSDHLGKILDIIRKCMENEGGELDRQQAENWFPVFGTIATRSESAAMLWLQFAREDTPGEAPSARWITFAEVSNEQEITLSSSPVLAASALEESLWSKCFGVVLTSATLTALGNFDFFSLRAGLHKGAHYSRIASPFDYTNNGLLRIPRTGFDPSNAQAHTQSIVGILPEILDLDKGSLVLFSSRRQLQDVIYGLDDQVKEKILSQDDYSKQQLISIHKENIDSGQGSIIFGLASLTEGIDLPGDYCTHVVIAKIPFSVPNDPVEATLGQWIKDQGKNPFIEVSVPEAAMRIIQGSGRLLRTESDSGTITILDERLMTKRYGQSIIDSLPPYTLEVF